MVCLPLSLPASHLGRWIVIPRDLDPPIEPRSASRLTSLRTPRLPDGSSAPATSSTPRAPTAPSARLPDGSSAPATSSMPRAPAASLSRASHIRLAVLEAPALRTAGPPPSSGPPPLRSPAASHRAALRAAVLRFSAAQAASLQHQRAAPSLSPLPLSTGTVHHLLSSSTMRGAPIHRRERVPVRLTDVFPVARPRHHPLRGFDRCRSAGVGAAGEKGRTSRCRCPLSLHHRMTPAAPASADQPISVSLSGLER